MLDQFHFLEPDWLYALLPLAFVLWGLSKSTINTNPWEKLVDAHLLKKLVGSQTHKPKKSKVLYFLSLAWLIAIIALANPVWEKRQQTVFQTSAARVLVLDLSTSMNATDILPSRLIAARLKIIDILHKDYEGQTALVVFAGDAFVVSPLTRDTKTIESLLKVLEPRLLPVQGSRIDLGLIKAQQLFKQSSINQGDILVFADGIGKNTGVEVAKQIKLSGHHISVIGMATEAGATLPNLGVKTTLEKQALEAIVKAGAGVYRTYSTSDADINSFLSQAKNNNKKTSETTQETNIWFEQGPSLALLLLPLALIGFRRNLLFTFLVLPLISIPPTPVYAYEWDDLWQRPDQQASKALLDGNNKKAAQLATDVMTKGAALYREGEFKSSLVEYNNDDSPTGHYNKANTLANLKRYEDAIKSYDTALENKPAMDDAIFNRDLIKKLLEQQKKEQEKEDDKDNNKDKQKDNKSGEGSPDENQEKQKQEDNNKKEQSKNEFDDANESGEKDKEKEPDAESKPEVEDQKSNQEQETQPVESEAKAENLTDEEKMAAEQWLRRIPDDPGGLLRRKFLYQYQQRPQSRNAGDNQEW